jgi:hypothetical protein
MANEKVEIQQISENPKPQSQTECSVNLQSVTFCHRCGFTYANRPTCPRCGHRDCPHCGDS